MEKKSSDINHLLLKFVFRQSSSSEDQEIERWLASNKSNSLLLEKLVRAKANLGDETSLKVENKIAKPKIHKLRKFTRHILRFAAVFIGVSMISYGVYSFLEYRNQQWKSINVAKGNTRQIVLKDGTKVYLAPDTKLSYPNKFPDTERAVKLNGQAYFDVAHDEDRPFKVHTSHTLIEVLGTKFNVKAYQNEALTTTVLEKGKVKICYKSDKGEAIGNSILQANQKSEFAHQNLQFTVTNADMNDDLAWRNNRLFFKNESFREIANEMERHYNIKIVFENEQLGTQRFSGEFQNESIDAVLETFKEWMDFNYRINKNVVYIK